MPTPYSPERLIDFLLERLHLNNDKALSRKLGIALPVLHGLRAGLIAPAASLLLCMAEKAGCDIDALRRVLGDRRRTMRLACAASAA